MDIVTFASLISGYLFIGFSLFWAILGLALHKKLEAPVGLAIGLTLVLQFLGMGILVVRYLMLRAKNESDTVSSDWDSSQWASGDSSFAPDWGSNSDHWVSETKTERGVTTWVVFALQVATILAFIISLFLPWFYQSIDIFDPSVYILSTGLEIWLFISLVTFAASAILVVFQKSYLWQVILVAHFSTWWLALGLASLSDRYNFAKAMEAMFNLPNLVTGLDDGFGVEFVNQTAGEAWFLVFPAAAMAVGSAFVLAKNYSETSD